MNKLKRLSKTILLCAPAWCLIGLSARAQTPSPTPSPTATPSNQLTAEKLLSVRTISDVRFSPDGQQVAFVVTEPVKGTTRARHIWMLDVKTREVRQSQTRRKQKIRRAGRRMGSDSHLFPTATMCDRSISSQWPAVKRSVCSRLSTRLITFRGRLTV